MYHRQDVVNGSRGLDKGNSGSVSGAKAAELERTNSEVERYLCDPYTPHDALRLGGYASSCSVICCTQRQQFMQLPTAYMQHVLR